MTNSISSISSFINLFFISLVFGRASSHSPTGTLPLIGKLFPEAKWPLCTEGSPQHRNNLLAIVKAVERGVFNCDEHIGDSGIVERVCRLGHAQLPTCIDSKPLERQQHVLLGIQFKK